MRSVTEPAVGARAFGYSRRSALAALAATGALAGCAAGLRQAERLPSLDPVNPDMRFGITGFIYQQDIAGAIATTARFGLQGLEPYRQHIMQYVSRPQPLKAMFEAGGLELITCSNGGPGQQSNFIDRPAVAQTIADHVRFAREFLVPFGATHWKINVGGRPEGGPSPEQLRVMADTLNELGRQTAALGIRLAPHPHIWGPLEREEEVRFVMENTDPRHVWLTADTAHLVLGGMDPVKIVADYFPRVAEIHLKDCEVRHRGNRSTPTTQEHARAALYKNLGQGGAVDFPALFQVLRDRGFKGWVALDLDPPRPGDGTGDVAQNIATNIAYLRDRLGVRLPPPAR